MSIRKQLDVSEWQERLQTITSGNRGRTAAIAAEGTTLVEQKAFESINYDPVGKGNDITVSVDGFAHTVATPVDIFIEENDNGTLSTLEVIDQNGKSNFLRLI